MALRVPWMPEIEDDHDVPLSECALCPEPIRIEDDLVWWRVGLGDETRQAHRSCFRRLSG